MSYHSNQIKSTQQTLPMAQFQQGCLGQRESEYWAELWRKVTLQAGEYIGKGHCLNKTQEAENGNKHLGQIRTLNLGSRNRYSQRQCWKGWEGLKVAGQTDRPCLERSGEPQWVGKQQCKFIRGMFWKRHPGHRVEHRLNS